MHDLQSWIEEQRSAYLYDIIAKKEHLASKKKLFTDLAASARKQASMWEVEYKKTCTTPLPVFKPDFRTRLVGQLLTVFSVQQLRFILSTLKVRGMSLYSEVTMAQPHAHSHHHSGSPQAEVHHKGLNAAGNLRAAVFGVNDGLISNMSLLLGLVGAGSGAHALVLTGIAGLLAGSCSMAAGEYISMRSQREFFEYQIALEKEELEFYPEEEAAELAFIYEARGIPIEEAKALANKMISNPKRALETLVKEELGLNPDDLGSPIGAALASFISFACGAAIPLIPFLFGTEIFHLKISLSLTAVTLFTIGATLSLFTNCSALKSGFRMLTIGSAAGLCTYLIGTLVGG